MNLADWDGESYCTFEGCYEPATHRRILAMTDDETPVYEMVCCGHAQGTP